MTQKIKDGAVDVSIFDLNGQSVLGVDWSAYIPKGCRPIDVRVYTDYAKFTVYWREKE